MVDAVVNDCGDHVAGGGGESGGFLLPYGMGRLFGVANPGNGSNYHHEE